MNEIGRRDFLYAAGAAAAATKISALGADKKIRTAIWGIQHGHTTGKLKALLDSPDYEVVAVHEPDEAARKERQGDSRFQGLRWTSEKEILEDPSIDLVVVECFIWEAIPRGEKVIAAGKHLHLEKPPSHQLEPFRKLVETARKKGLLLQMGYVWRFHPAIDAAFEAARQGWLGDVYMLRGTINKDVQPHQRPQWARYGGGTMFELGGHVIDRFVDFWGRPQRVRAWLRNDTIPDGFADNTLAVLEYEQGMAVACSCAVMAGSSRHRSFEVIGTEGSFVIQPAEPGSQVRVVMREAKGPYRKGWQDIEMPRHQRYIGDFIEVARALKTGEPLRYDYDYELTLQETLLRASGEIS